MGALDSMWTCHTHKALVAYGLALASREPHKDIMHDLETGIVVFGQSDLVLQQWQFPLLILWFAQDPPNLWNLFTTRKKTIIYTWLVLYGKVWLGLSLLRRAWKQKINPQKSGHSNSSPGTTAMMCPGNRTKIWPQKCLKRIFFNRTKLSRYTLN